MTGHELYKSLVEQGRNEGLRIGRQQGLRTLVRVVVRKLGRPLTDDGESVSGPRAADATVERPADMATDIE